MVRGGIQIGKISKQTGLSIDAIRFYEKQRLLDHPPRSEGGFRLFSAEDIERIQFFRRAQQLGFSLAEIRELLLEEQLTKRLRKCERKLCRSGCSYNISCPALEEIARGESDES